LNISETASINGSIARFEGAQGRYQLNDDCTGGTLTFYVGSRPVQFDFFLLTPEKWLWWAAPTETL